MAQFLFYYLFGFMSVSKVGKVCFDILNPPTNQTTKRKPAANTIMYQTVVRKQSL